MEKPCGWCQSTAVAIRQQQCATVRHRTALQLEPQKGSRQLVNRQLPQNCKAKSIPFSHLKTVWVVMPGMLLGLLLD